MKRLKFLLVLVSLLLVCVILAGCGTSAQAADLMEGITARQVASVDTKAYSTDVTDFCVRLFKANEKDGENTLISPLSVLCALSMTANGAKGQTLSQMESVLGLNTEELNNFVYSYTKSLPKSEDYKLSIANSIWFTDSERFAVNRDFLTLNADYYGADIYKAPFDKSTRDDINNWVCKKTDNMIKEVLDEVPRDAIMYLVNALAFEAEWEECYEEHQVREGTFTNREGNKQKCEFMYSSESAYLEDDNATGFIKCYKDDEYAFVALKPDENVDVSEYVKTLSGEKLQKLISNKQYGNVKSAIPKFETEYSTDMAMVLSEMGMSDAFSVDKADFTGLGTSSEDNIFISRVLHKTYISVAEKGTRAGAATVVETKCGSSAVTETKKIYLDRPFVYMIIDCKNNIPFFIGTMNDIEK